MKKIRFLIGVIAIIALTGSLWMACDSSSDGGGGGGGGDGGDPAISGWNGGKAGGGGGGGRTPPSGAPPTATFSVGRTTVVLVPEYVTVAEVTYTGTNLAAAPTFAIAQTGTYVTVTAGATNSATSGKFTITLDDGTNGDTATVTLTGTATGAAGGAEISRAIDVLIYDLVDPSISLTGTIPDITYYDSDDADILAVLWADVDILLEDPDNSGFPTEGVTLTLGACELTLGTWTAGSAGVVTAELFTGVDLEITTESDIVADEVTELIITAAPDAFGDSPYSVSYFVGYDDPIPAETDLANLFDGFTFIAVWANPRVTTATRGPAPEGDYDGYGLEVIDTPDFGTDVTYTVAAVDAGSTSYDETTADNYVFTFVYETTDAEETVTIAIWTILDKSDGFNLVVTDPTGLEVPSGSGANKAAIFAQLEDLITAGLVIEVKYSNPNEAGTVLKDVTALIDIGDLNDTGNSYGDGSSNKFTVEKFATEDLESENPTTDDYFTVDVLV